MDTRCKHQVDKDVSKLVEKSMGNTYLGWYMEHEAQKGLWRSGLSFQGDDIRETCGGGTDN